MAFGGDRSHDRPFAQQPSGVILVLDANVEEHVGKCAKDRGEPRRH
jgi:hypothetical protein